VHWQYEGDAPGAGVHAQGLGPVVHHRRGGGARGRTDVPKIVDWYMEGKINIDDLITHRLPLERTNERFDLIKKDESVRSVVLY